MSFIGRQFLDTVVFLVGDRGPSATAFLVDVPDETRLDTGVRYLVTARHNLEEARRDAVTVPHNIAASAAVTGATAPGAPPSATAEFATARDA